MGLAQARPNNNIMWLHTLYIIIIWGVVHEFTEIFAGDITIPGGMTYTLVSSLDADPSQFSLTCISTGGPATTVTWTRDSETLSEGNMTVLDNRETAQYTHTLTVSGRLGGLYQCTVSNNKPSSASAQLNVQEGNVI